MTQTGLDYLKLVESNRHNVSTERQAINELDESRRSHMANEDIAREGNQINLISANAAAKNADTNYLNYQVNKQNADTNYLNYTVNRYDSRTRRKQYNLDHYYKTNMVRQGDQQLKETATHNRNTEGLKSKEINTNYIISQLSNQTKKDIAQSSNQTKKDIATQTNATSRDNTKTKSTTDYNIASLNNITKGQLAEFSNETAKWIAKYKTDSEMGYKYTNTMVESAFRLFRMFTEMFDISDDARELISN